MNTAALHRDQFMPQPLPGRGPGWGLALFAHGLLVLALAIGVSWRASPPAAVHAELWAEVPRAAQPERVVPPVTPSPQPVVSPPEPRQPTTPSSQDAEDAQIAIAKAKREKALEEARNQRDIEKKKAKDEADKAAQKLAAQRKAQEDQREKQDTDRTNAAREAQLKRIQGLAGSSSASPITAKGNAAPSSGPSADYLGRVAAQIKPHINNPSVSGNPSVVFEIFLAADGRIVSQRLISPSGVSAWDDAVERGIIDTKILPRLPDGTAPKSIILSVRPGD